ncbi:hypothetical protein [Bradyrhizobium altum]|uniref:hypothetical protein n=1 Tax=Bradyrhizobium altum TaxID=1571202 RepID=UPI001E457C33|nr:hypothetical protein [Bradyrhizobium altum]
MQDVQVQYETVDFQLQAAKAAQLSARLAMDSEIGGVNTTVAQVQAQLDNAKWELEQTTIHAIGDGPVTVMALAVGDRAMQARAVMSYILEGDIVIAGMFSPQRLQDHQARARVKLVFDDDPGCIHQATVMTIPQGVGQGQIAVSGSWRGSARSAALSSIRRSFPSRRPSTAASPGSGCRHRHRVRG